MLHDIAKGSGGDHSVWCDDIAMYLGPRLALSAAETGTSGLDECAIIAMSNTPPADPVLDTKTIDRSGPGAIARGRGGLCC